MARKLKTHRGLAKRVKITGTGKLRRRRAGRRHLMTGKPSARTRKMRRDAGVHPGEVAAVKRQLPYGVGR